MANPVLLILHLLRKGYRRRTRSDGKHSHGFWQDEL